MESVIKPNTKNQMLGDAKTEERTLLSGIVTGQVAGLIMAVVVMLVFAVFLGKNPLYPVQVIGSALLGEVALQGLSGRPPLGVLPRGVNEPPGSRKVCTTEADERKPPTESCGAGRTPSPESRLRRPREGAGKWIDA